jgi:long-chain acyl-CoA synthetase
MLFHPTHHSKSMPDKPAVIMGGTGEVVTYGQLEARSNQGAQLFRALGLKRGDAIALMLDNGPRFHEICFAAQRAGLIYTAMSTRLSEAEATYIVGDCGARLLIASATLAPVAKAMLAASANVRDAFSVDGRIDGFKSWEAARDSQPAMPIADQVAGQDMLYSSGTTGRPKGIRAQLLDDAFDAPTRLVQSAGALYGFDGDTRYLSPAPLYHAAPLRFTMTVLRMGGTVVVMEKFDEVAALALIEKYRITHSQWVPSMFVRMLKLPEATRATYSVASMKVAIHAAAPCPLPVKEKMIAWWGPVLYEYYAGTEGNGFVACNSAEWLAHRGTVGRAITGDIRIVGLDGTVQPPGPEHTGTIYFANAPTFEYHNDAEKTAASRTPEGWSTLGDVGYVDADGFLYLTDRKAHMIISGGVNIYPQEVEDLLVTHPRIADAAVIGVPNEEFGEEVKAVIQPLDWKDATPAFAAELIAFCRAHISHVKCPRSVDFDRELPRHPTGKLYKRLIRDRYWAGRASKLV